jgi:hypothetical protein
MSLAMYAAPFDNDINQVNNKDNDNHIGRKRVALNKTQKRYPKENNFSEKVNSVLQTIHNSLDQEEGLADFNPPPPPDSAGVENTRLRETQTSASGLSTIDSGVGVGEGAYMSSDHSSDMASQLQQMQQQQMQQQQQKQDNRFMPNYAAMYKNSPHNMPYHNYNGYSQMNSSPSSGSSYDVMIEKLNYMINLLEEQKDERTNNVTEEVVLYSFLGIFIIFVVDSFARVGKYTR